MGCNDLEPSTARQIPQRVVCMRPIAQFKLREPTWPTRLHCELAYINTAEKAWKKAITSQLTSEINAVSQFTGDGLMRVISERLGDRLNPRITCVYDHTILNFMRAFSVFDHGKPIGELSHSIDVKQDVASAPRTVERMLSAGLTDEHLGMLRSLLVTGTSGCLSKLASLSCQGYYHGDILKGLKREEVLIDFSQAIFSGLAAGNPEVTARLNKGEFLACYLEWCLKAFVLSAIKRGMFDTDYKIGQAAYPNILMCHRKVKDGPIHKFPYRIMMPFGEDLVEQAHSTLTYFEKIGTGLDPQHQLADGLRILCHSVDRDMSGANWSYVWRRLNFVESEFLLETSWNRVKPYVMANPFDRHGMLSSDEERRRFESEKHRRFLFTEGHLTGNRYAHVGSPCSCALSHERH